MVCSVRLQPDRAFSNDAADFATPANHARQPRYDRLLAVSGARSAAEVQGEYLAIALLACFVADRNLAQSVECLIDGFTSGRKVRPDPPQQTFYLFGFADAPHRPSFQMLVNLADVEMAA
jgi:hypothetical protein